MKLFDKLFRNSSQIRKILETSKIQMEARANKNFENIWKNICEKYD